MIHAASSATRDSYFGERSMIRRVMGERAVAFSGARSLLMQAAHPLAVAGLLAHSDSLEDPYDRLARTAQVLDAITFGSRAEADRLTARVRAMHRRVRGELPETVGIYPAGTPYRADDPELLMWILYTLIDSASLFYSVYVAGLRRCSAGRCGRTTRSSASCSGCARRRCPTRSTTSTRTGGRWSMATGSALGTGLVAGRGRSYSSPRFRYGCGRCWKR